MNVIKKYNILIAGARGRDLQNFIVYFRDNPLYNVVCFTATQIPGIENQFVPKEITGKLYPRGIPTYPESQLQELIKKHNIDYVYLSYSDLSHQYVMEFASKVLAAGANFALLGTRDTYIQSKKPVISVTAVRTGSGKSQTTRAIAEIFKKQGKKVVGIRHPMPYGDLVQQEVQRFETTADLKKNKCTIEEEEEYQPWIDHGFVIYAGVDYQKIIKQAEKEADVILWDGGNNDWSFYKPDLNIVVADPHRAGHELTYYPGFVNILMADIVIINKVDSVSKENVQKVQANIKKYNPQAKIILAKSDVFVEDPKVVKNKRVLVVGDGPTLSHGGMSFGAATLAAQKYGGKIVDVKPFVIGSIKQTYQKYPQLGKELPAMGYSSKQLKEVEQIINKVPCDLILDGSPAHLKKHLKLKKPIIDVTYELDQKSVKELERLLSKSS